MAQTCPPGPASGLQAQDKAAEAKPIQRWAVVEPLPISWVRSAKSLTQRRAGREVLAICLFAFALCKVERSREVCVEGPVLGDDAPK